MSRDRYQFRAERIQALLSRCGGAVEVDDLGDRWEELVTDGSDTAHLMTDGDLARAADEIGTVTRFDPRHEDGVAAALRSLATHEDCAEAIADLQVQRDDVLAALLSTRGYCFNDMSEGQYGDLYLTAEDVLDHLRPSLPGRGVYLGLDAESEECPDCGLGDYDHEDWCDWDERLATAADRREHAIASHLHCAEIGRALADHITRCLERAESVAARVREHSYDQPFGLLAVDPHKVLAAIRVADLNVPLEPLTVETLAMALPMPLLDETYCGEFEGYHTTPHRACRFLIS